MEITDGKKEMEAGMSNVVETASKEMRSVVDPVAATEIPLKTDIKNEIERDIRNTSFDFGTDRMAQELEREREWAILTAAERRDLITMRSRWSNWILGVIVAISLFDIFLVTGIGFGWLKYENNFQIPFFIGESLIKLLGLAFLIVHFLFDHKSLSGSYPSSK